MPLMHDGTFGQCFSGSLCSLSRLRYISEPAHWSSKNDAIGKGYLGRNVFKSNDVILVQSPQSEIFTSMISRSQIDRVQTECNNLLFRGCLKRKCNNLSRDSLEDLGDPID